ncbi:MULTISPECIES: hypothetical protein [unclassified Streptococcus]|uniref:hypothetical protein n=1 Tax=unclassified Streptococcus TaxID=2608887 RepID=UPI00211B2FDF|nr:MULTISPECIES: hypothetical protein [unclassified Streptococcus]MCQ9212408.1 hypothetical protein [Streptococcus sp. B01]MCQ9214493.1 hypothetical protein [Streptococcus sp. O1]
MGLRKKPIEKKKEPQKRMMGKQKANTEDYFDLYSCVELLDVKRILENRQEYIELRNGYYLQFLEIPGKDLDSLSEAEVVRTLRNFEIWLSKFSEDGTIESTILPTNTDSQIFYQRKALAEVERAMKQEKVERLYLQLKDRKERLLEEILIEEQIQKEFYNAEFILWLFAETITELDEVVRKAKNSGNHDFVPREISRLKKEQILKQYNNMNEKI